MGHLARLLEQAGIATVIVAIRAFRSILVGMTLPRVLLTPHVLGRPVGPPQDSERQAETLRAALELLESAKQGGAIQELRGAYSVRGI